MDLTLAEAERRVGLDAMTISRALASYVRSVLSGDAPYDRFINGDRGALSHEQQRGLQIFRGKGNCTACHLGPSFSEPQLKNRRKKSGRWRISCLADTKGGARRSIVAQAADLCAAVTR